jgi:mono/diheme cytochrome c family protein
MSPPTGRDAENEDPHEQFNPVPRVVLGLALALAAWGVSYIVMQRPDSAPALGDKRVAAELGAAASSGGGAVDGRQLFAANCQACHQATGQGLPGVFPPLAGSQWVTGDPQTLTQIVLHGLTGQIEVRGANYQGAMPAFGSQFDDVQIAAVLSFVRSEWGNAAPPLDAQVVATARKASSEREAPWQGAAELVRATTAGATSP